MSPRTLPWKSYSVSHMTVYSYTTHFVTAPGKHRQWDGNGYVDADLAHIHIALKFTRGCPRLCEDCSAIAVSIVVDYFKSVVKRLGFENDQHGSKDFFPTQSWVIGTRAH